MASYVCPPSSSCPAIVILTCQALARETQATLPNLNDPSRLQALVDDLEKQISTIQRCNLRNAGSETGELGAAGVALWNLCTHLKRDQDGQPSPVLRKALVCSRVFAFLVVTIPESGTRNELRTLIRYLRLAIRTGRSCIGKSQMSPPVHACIRD